jgi:hypothetical protein
MIIAIMLILIIALPVYLFRACGAAKGAIATVLFILFLFACGILSTLGEITVLGINNI